MDSQRGPAMPSRRAPRSNLSANLIATVAQSREAGILSASAGGFAMPRRFVDLSITLCNEVVSDPPFMRPKIEYLKHRETMRELGHFFPGVGPEETPGGAGFAAAEVVTLSTHNGTHLDAPWHFHPTQDARQVERPSLTIDEIPLEWCFQPGVKLDFRHFADGYVVTAEDVEEQ